MRTPIYPDRNPLDSRDRILWYFAVYIYGLKDNIEGRVDDEGGEDGKKREKERGDDLSGRFHVIGMQL